MSDDGTKLKKYSASLHGGSTGEPGWVLSLASLVASNRWETVRAPVEVAAISSWRDDFIRDTAKLGIWLALTSLGTDRADLYYFKMDFTFRVIAPHDWDCWSLPDGQSRWLLDSLRAVKFEELVFCCSVLLRSAGSRLAAADSAS